MLEKKGKGQEMDRKEIFIWSLFATPILNSLFKHCLRPESRKVLFTVRSFKMSITAYIHCSQPAKDWKQEPA